MAVVEEKTKDLATEERFRKLAKAWKSETELISKVTKRAMHPAYQKIIGMGQAAIPFLLRELETNADNWFWALMMITDENPVSEEIRGDGAAMAQAWLRWGKKHGYEW